MHRIRQAVGEALRGGMIPVGLVVVAALAILVVAPPSSADAQNESGADLYTTHCAACHQADGGGLSGTFPPLTGNPAAADATYVSTVITEGKSGPLDVLGESYDEVMPPVVGLSDAQLAALTDFVVELAGGASEPSEPPPPVDAPAVGDVDGGRDLFVGSNRLDNGGGACASCHSAGSVGSFGGNTLGPDLTGVYSKFGGEAGVTAWLGNPASETMRPIFEDRPMTEDEIADVVAFLADAPVQDRPNDSADWLLLFGSSGLLVLLGGMAVAWRGMRQPYVSTLRSRR